MNLDVPLDELIKSKSNKRPGGGGGANAKANARRRPNPVRAKVPAGPTNKDPTNKDPFSSKDPFSVPLDTLIASKPRAQSSAPQTQQPRRVQQQNRARLQSRRYFAGAIRRTQTRDAAGGAGSGLDTRVSGKVSTKRPGPVNLRSNYSKGLAAQVNRSRRSISVPPAARNLSINRRPPRSNPRQRRPPSVPPHNRWPQVSSSGSSRSIAFQPNRGLHRHAAQHVTETMPYNTGLGHGAATAVYRQGDIGPSGVAPPLYDKTVVTSQPHVEHHQETASSVFSESDRSMFSKIKIMAQLDKISVPVTAPQRQYAQPEMGAAAPRFRTLSDRFLS